MRKKLSVILIAFLILLTWACTGSPEKGSEEHIRSVTSAVDHDRMLVADDNPEDWLGVGRNYSEDRYSTLAQITKENINELGLAWSINLGIYRGIEATPIVVDGIMYLSGPWSMVYAIDVRKGEIIWIYDPEVPREVGIKVCCDVVNRGVSLYKGMIYLGTLDGRLVALDAVAGDVIWETVTVDQSKAYTITGGTRVFDGKVLIGCSGAEYGVRGYVSAYDAYSGEMIWRFYTVPGNPADGFESKAMEEAAKTWTGEWWTMGGGGTVWDAIVYDPALNLVYIGTGNGSPWNQQVRSPEGGDNLYLSSIVALHLETGEMEWYYQQIPGETFDYTATQPIILADIEIDGARRKVLLQAPKNGFFYVLDRTNGDLISAEPYVYVNWATHIDKNTGRPVETENARFNEWTFQLAPSAFGGHNWHPMAYNPETGLVYIPAREASGWVGPPKNFKFNDDGRAWNTGMAGWRQDIPRISDPKAQQNFGKLIAWDPVRQHEVWSVRQSSTWNGGVLSTGDMIFQGDAKGIFRAFDASSGKELWSYNLGTGIMAAPCTYMVDGVQYVSVAVGWGGAEGLFGQALTKQVNPGTVYTFALGKNASLPDFGQILKKELVQMPFEASLEEIQHGSQLANQNSCFRCHGGGGALPNLLYSSSEVYESFDMIVRQGIFLGKGMPGYEEQMSEQDVQDLKHFFLNQAKKEREKRLGLSSFGIVGDALPAGWDKSFPLEKTDNQGVWTGKIKLNKGEVKFRANDDWEDNWGGGTFPEGKLNVNGNNIEVESGTYLVTVNLLNNRYAFARVSD